MIDFYNRGKNTVEIARQPTISFRDFGAILQRADGQKDEEPYISISSQAYAILPEGKAPLQLAFRLSMREADVTKLYRVLESQNLRERVPYELRDEIRMILPREKPISTIGSPVVSFGRVLEGILYLIRTGCQWRILPKEYDSGSTCHRGFQQW